MADTWVTLGVILLGVVVVVGGILALRLHAFLALIFGAIVVATFTPRENVVQYYMDSKQMVRTDAERMADQTVPNRIAEGFGNTCASIGILIAMAAIIGKCLLDSGAADRIVRSALRLFGERGAPAAFMSSGFVLGIPVFFDTVFYLMIPLGKALRMRTGRNYLLYVLTIVCGATMAHSLVPPTPGPLFVAEQLGVNLGLMILAGTIVGLVTAGVGYLFAVVANRIWDLPLRESPDLSVAELEAAARVEDGELPPLWLSLVPILLPVVLISGQTILERGYFGLSAGEGLMRIANTLGDKTIALTLSAIIAMATVVWQKRTKLQELSESSSSSRQRAGPSGWCCGRRMSRG
jgi:gluconate:H+ symporter, GntP family